MKGNKMSKKIWAICGGDWYDASVDYLILPDGMCVKEEKKKYGEWYQNMYRKQQRGAVTFMRFADWLIKAGATIPSEDVLEEFWYD